MNTSRFYCDKPALFVACLSVTVLAGYQISDAGMMYGVTDTAAQQLISFDTADPTQLLSALVLQGLGPNEHVMSIDFAPDGKLYGLSSAGRIYQIRLADASLTQRGDLYPFQLDGTSFSLAINPARPDEFRIASNLGQNLRFDLTSGQTVRESDFALQPGFPFTTPGPAEITALAYGPGPNPTLYGLYRYGSLLARIGGPGGSPSPDTGQVTGLAFLNNARLGFSPALVILPSGQAFYEADDQLYSISLSAPPTTYNPPFVGYVGDGEATQVPVLSLAAFPEPYTAGLLACGLLLWRRRHCKPPGVLGRGCRAWPAARTAGPVPDSAGRRPDQRPACQGFWGDQAKSQLQPDYEKSVDASFQAASAALSKVVLKPASSATVSPRLRSSVFTTPCPACAYGNRPRQHRPHGHAAAGRPGRSGPTRATAASCTKGRASTPWPARLPLACPWGGLGPAPQFQGPRPQRQPPRSGHVAARADPVDGGRETGVGKR